MTTLGLTVKVNNQSADSVIVITNGRPIISWIFDPIDIVVPDEYGEIISQTVIEQADFRVRIGTSQTNWGTWMFAGSVKHTGVVSSTARSWAYSGPLLEKGVTYYGQILVKDTEGNFSSWETFSLLFNQVPVATAVTLTPANPSVDDDLKLTYSYSDPDSHLESGTLIKWFRNNVYERQFDNQITINNDLLRYNDTWTAHVLPSDSYETGARAISNVALVTTGAPVSSGIKILPLVPNENDILKADYVFSGDIVEDKSRIRWYVNESLDESVNDQKFVRLSIVAGDKVRFETQPFDGVKLGKTVASETATIVSSKFAVENVRVEGRRNPLDILTLRPIIAWEVLSPSGKIAEYVSIRIGNAPGSDNVYSTTINSRQRSFNVPENLLNRGSDYFVSIAVNDTATFENYAISHFKTTGSRWVDKASNNGWTIEAVFATDGSTFDEANYQIIRIQDGTQFGEVRIYSDRFAFMASDITFSTIEDLSRFRILTIVGEGKDVKMYMDRKLILDASGLFDQSTTDKQLEFGSVQGTLTVKYQSFCYTVDGSFHPGVADEFKDLQFHKYADFPFHEAVGLKGFVEDNENRKVFAINPNDDNESGSVLAIAVGSKKPFNTAVRTFSPINNASRSPNSVYKVFSHARGASVFRGHFIDNYDHLIDFTGTSVDPVDNGWELVQNIGTSSARQNNGWEIDTTV